MQITLRDAVITLVLAVAIFGAFHLAQKLSPPMPDAASLDPEARSELLGTR